MTGDAENQFGGHKAFYGVTITALLAMAVATVVVILVGHLGTDLARLPGSVVVLAVYSLTAYAGVTLFEKSRVAWLAVFTVGLSIAAFIVAFTVNWTGGNQGGWGKVGFVLFSLAAATAIASYLIGRQRDDDGRPVKIVLAASLGILVVLTVLSDIGVVADVGDSFFLRVIGAVAVLWVVSTVVLAVVRKAGKSLQNTPLL